MNFKNSIKHFCGRHPTIFFPLYRFMAPEHHIKECMLNESSELVIEGFPRSANTFAVVAFRQAQGRDVPMAHHLHVEAQILKGVSRGLPVIVLIRNPIDSVRSLIIRHPLLTIEDAFQRYIEFYAAVERVADRVVVADFKNITSNFGEVIDKVNKKYGTEYELFKHCPENLEAVYEEIDAINSMIDAGKETHVARPSKEREKIKVAIPPSPISKHAETIYNRLMEIND